MCSRLVGVANTRGRCDMGRLADKAQAAAEGVTDRAIRKRRKAAVDRAKAKKKPQSKQAISDEAIEAIIGAEEADRRWRVARARKVEDSLARDRGDLLSRAEVVTAVARTYAEAKATLLAIPGQLVVRFGVSSEVSQSVEELIKSACESLHTKWKT